MHDLDPEQDQHPSQSGRNFDEDLQFRYFSPGAFTVLPPDEMPTPDPPQAPVSYRLTPTTRRNRNQAFSIIAEPTSRDASRSPSPTGRISPFKGRGFNPSGSRHTSPTSSPHPELGGGNSKPSRTTKKSKIPQMNRRNSSGLFGEKVTHSEQSSEPSPSKKSLNSKLSKSMTNINPNVLSKKPPPSPQKGTAKNPAFQQLSPIIGSSPEPSQSQSSPSRIPTRSRSQPQSRVSSPNRPPVKTKPKLATRTKISTSRVQSRNSSREPSPSGKSSVPSKLAAKYRNVPSKVDSFCKPKVLSEPHMTSDSELSDIPANKNPKYRTPDSHKFPTNVKKNGSNLAIKSKFINTTSNTDITAKSGNISKKHNRNIVNEQTVSPNTETIVNNVKKISAKKKPNTLAAEETSKIENVEVTINSTKIMDQHSNLGEKIWVFNDETVESATDVSVENSELLNNSSTANIVPTTAATITKPLKIDTNVGALMKQLPRGISPMVDGRVLSATSVSQAINKMNDTVLDTKTLIRESELSKLSPAASAIISMYRENNFQSPNKNKTQDKEQIEIKHLDDRKGSSTYTSEKNDKFMISNTNTYKINNGNLDANNFTKGQYSDKGSVGNHVTSTGLMDSKTLEVHLQNNIDKLINTEKVLIQKSESEKLRESRTVFAPEIKPVQPIQILVKEKPNDQDVESGNVRLPVSVTNGSFHGRPSLPPDHSHNSNNASSKKQESPSEYNTTISRITIFFSSAKKHLLCKTCKRNSIEESTNVSPRRLEDETEKTKGCFSCLKIKQLPDRNIKIKIEEAENEVKETCWNRLKCCKLNDKIDEQQGCLPFRKKKSAWKERRDSILRGATNRPTRAIHCKNFMKKLLCLHLCEKKNLEDLSMSRRGSTSSKKKSLTPTAQPLEDQTPKLDLSLVEHTSHMKAAIPVLPICLAWFCLVMNCLLPGTGTTLSGILCLCIGKPRFSQKDSIRSRIGAFIIDCIVGASQTFTILFCLVGWGWSIWWGIIMVKIARKYKKIKILADAEEVGGKRASIINHSTRLKDSERGP